MCLRSLDARASCYHRALLPKCDRLRSRHKCSCHQVLAIFHHDRRLRPLAIGIQSGNVLSLEAYAVLAQALDLGKMGGCLQTRSSHNCHFG